MAEWDHAPPEISPDAPGRWRPGRASREFGARLGASSDASGTLAGMLWIHGVGDMQVGLLSSRYRDYAAVGFGGRGLEGGLGTDVAMGLWPQLGPGHGPTLRIGARAELFGNRDYYTSWLELPQLQLGYAWLRSALRAELGARGGEILAGRFVTPDARRKINDHLAVGTYATLQVSVVRLDFEWIWVDQRGSLDRLERGGGRLCFVMGRWSLCADVQRWAAQRIGVGPVATQWLYLGASVGYIDEELR